MRIARFAMLLLVLAAGAARAQGHADGGTVLEIGGKQVPLAAGAWIAAGDAAGRLEPPIELGGYGMIRNRVFLRPAADGRGVAAMAEVNANELGTEEGWGLASACEPADGADAGILVRSGWDAACWFVTARRWDWTADMPPAWRQARAAAARAGLALPARTVTVGLRVANRSDVIDLRFHLPDTGGAALREVLAEWAATSLGLVGAGLTHGLAGRPDAAGVRPRTGGAGAGGDRAAAHRAAGGAGRPGGADREEAARQEAAVRATAAARTALGLRPGHRRGSALVQHADRPGADRCGADLSVDGAVAAGGALTARRPAALGAQLADRGDLEPGYPTAPAPDAARVVDFAYGGRQPAPGEGRCPLDSVRRPAFAFDETRRFPYADALLARGKHGMMLQRVGHGRRGWVRALIIVLACVQAVPGPAVAQVVANVGVSTTTAAVIAQRAAEPAAKTAWPEGLARVSDIEKQGYGCLVGGGAAAVLSAVGGATETVMVGRRHAAADQLDRALDRAGRHRHRGGLRGERAGDALGVAPVGLLS